MSYIEFRNAVRGRLMENASGMTWKELRDSAHLPYDRPCPEWVKQLETDIGLNRKDKRGNALLWRLQS